MILGSTCDPKLKLGENETDFYLRLCLELLECVLLLSATFSSGKKSK